MSYQAIIWIVIASIGLACLLVMFVVAIFEWFALKRDERDRRINNREANAHRITVSCAVGKGDCK